MSIDAASSGGFPVAILLRSSDEKSDNTIHMSDFRASVTCGVSL